MTDSFDFSMSRTTAQKTKRRNNHLTIFCVYGSLKMAEERSLEELVGLLASCRLDSWRASDRAAVLTEALERLEVDSLSDLSSKYLQLRFLQPNLKTDLGPIRSHFAAPSCYSQHAYLRVVKFYCGAINASEDAVILTSLCKSLCLLLRQSGSLDLVTFCCNTLKSKDFVVSALRDIGKETESFATLSLGSSMTDSVQEWLDMFIETTLSGTTVASAPQMTLARPLLRKVGQNEWVGTLAPMIGKKLKAMPEKVLETVQALVSELSDLDVTGDLEGDTQLLTSLLKQLKSAKPPNRALAQSMLVDLSSLKPTSMALPTISLALSNAIVNGTLIQADFRQEAYAALHKIGNAIPKEITIDASISSDVLNRLVTALDKELKTAISAKEAGIEALWTWVTIAKRNNGGGKGYDDALVYLRTGIVGGSGPETLLRISPLFSLFHVDIQESLIVDLCKDPKMEKGLQTLIDGATKKHASSSVIASLDGLIAVNIGLVNAVASESLSLMPGIEKVLSAGSLPLAKTSFLFGKTMTDAVSTNRLVSQLLSQTLVLYVKLLAKKEMDSNLFDSLKLTSAANAFSCCISHPTSSIGSTATDSVISAVQTVLTCQAGAADALAESLLRHINQITVENETAAKCLGATREARELFSPGEETQLKVAGKGQFSPTDSHHGFDTTAVRLAASKLASYTTSASSLVTTWLLMHVGTTRMTKGQPRSKMLAGTLKLIEDRLVGWSGKLDEQSIVTAVGEKIAMFSCSFYLVEDDNSQGDVSVSMVLHNCAMSLITTLGEIACLFDPTIDDPDDEEMKPLSLTRKICSNDLANRFSVALACSLQKVTALEEADVELYFSPEGVPFGDHHGGEDSCEVSAEKKSANVKKSGGKSKRGKGDFGGEMEDEEWERQMKKELAQKKAASSEKSSSTLSPVEKKIVEEQAVERQRISSIVDGDFHRVLSSIEALCLSDIDVGNSCLQVLGEAVLSAAITECFAYKSMPQLGLKTFSALTSLAACVYEIDEKYASDLAQALVFCCKHGARSNEEDPAKENVREGFVISAFPSPYPPASRIVSECEEFGDQLSGASFAFLFPILRAALTGPRTTLGCESALSVLSRHTPMLAGEDMDPAVAPLRKDMAAAVLELLSHDRSQTFLDPTPYEALVACYAIGFDSEGPGLSTADVAPLLDERGALGSKNCRVGAMIALQAIAENHQKLVKNNPLMENRIWTNCFDTTDAIRDAARAAWKTATSADGDALQSPSVMYAIPLLPLMTHADQSIAASACKANATAMGMHPSSVHRNIQKLCATYIQSYPTEFDDMKKKSPSLSMPAPLPSKKPIVVAPPPKKPISTGFPKKKTVAPKSALSIAGIGKPKVAKKKSSVTSALLKPKEDRTFDHELLSNQFKSVVKVDTEEKDSVEKCVSRTAMLNAITAITDPAAKITIESSTLELLTGFLMAYGLADGNDNIRGQARNALRDIVAAYGGSDEATALLLPNLESVLSSGNANDTLLGSLGNDKVPRDAAASDRRKEGAVVALGAVAIHLKGPENDGKIDTAVDMLFSALSTPSEGVQSSVAACLVKLMKKGRTQERVEDILSSLLQDCLNGEPREKRRGAAYGISAVVKGSGIASLKKYEIVKQLEDAFDTGSSTNKEGALYAIELLSDRLGLLFEPYVIVLLPSLLKAFSDGSDHVRSAASQTAGLIMSKLSAHGVKLVMPAVLSSFNDPNWRTKQASIQMLGSMSHLAPKQLASALPKVVPRLTEAFGDTHPKVKASAEEALEEISNVVKNPEISSISKVLLKALTDPAEGTIKALESLIETEFLHAIDAPSLALIVPILHRGLRDRVASSKRYGALIAGNICTMVNEPKDLIPYLPILLPDLKISLLDPIPDVRSTSAKALGSLTRGLGEDSLPELRSWLIEQLCKDEVTSAERSGAAQGLTEILIAGGASVVDDVMRDDILPLRSHPRAGTREGVLWVLTFLPSALGQAYTPLIDVTLPALVGGLSDDSEPVRDVAMRAGRVLIRSHGKVHSDKILPSLEAGFNDEDHRIRVASLTLLGDLLSLIGGTSVLTGDGNTQEDVRKAERAQVQISIALGSETRKRVLSSLYLARNDTTAAVRNSAAQVWKTVVSVTARTLRDILPVLVGQIVEALASGHPERTQVAGRCLGDIVQKLGDSVLPEIIPVLRNALYEGDKHTRTGVCVGLSEVISCSTRDQILRFIEIIVKVVQNALCDEDEGVRVMAASCFQSLHNVVGNRALDEIVPSLLVSLEHGGEQDVSRIRALNGLTGILSIRSRELLPYIIPRLIKSPITNNHARALSGIAAVTSTTLYSHFASIIPAIITELGMLVSSDNPAREESVRETARSICKHVDESGVNWLVCEIASKSANERAEIRKESCWMFQILVEESKCYTKGSHFCFIKFG